MKVLSWPLPAAALFLLPLAAFSQGYPFGNGGHPGIPNPPQTPVDQFQVLGPVNKATAEAAITEITVPPEFKATVFATPPVVNYPTGIAATPDGTLFVTVDGNGARSAFEHMGRVIRLKDTDGDGVADQVSAFVPDVDSPRGVIWYRDHIIVMHAPNISAYYDHNGDGVADEEKILVHGVGKPLTDSNVDHGQNGIELGIDGWIYLAEGDQGFVDAVGSDGKHLTLHGGGVVRFRPDGSNIEIWAKDTRNIYGVAIGPQLDAFARDNTNDGGGWNVRFHQFSGLTDHGYPSLFINFPDEFTEPLADFGGGSGTGATWIDEPGIPARLNKAAYTTDNGREGVFRHAMVPNGAGYALDQTPAEAGTNVIMGNQPVFLVRSGMDVEIDANSNIYIAAWRGGGVAWAGPERGIIYKVALNTGFKPDPLPDYTKLGAADLVKQLESPSSRRRLLAQVELLARPELAAQAGPLLETLAADRTKDLNYRIASLFTYRQVRGAASTPFIARQVADPSIEAWALRALGDDRTQARGIPTEVVQSALKSNDPRIRKEAIVTLTRAESTASIPAIAPLMADKDDIVWHAAVESLRTMNAVDVPLAILDSTASSAEMRRGALQVLEVQHDPKVVAAVAARAERETNADKQLGLVSALSRLANVEAPWNGAWWTTRPSNVGPYYQAVPWAQTQNIQSTIDTAVSKAGPEETVKIGLELLREGVPAGAAAAKFVAYADTEPKLLPAIASYYATADSVPDNAVPVLVKMAKAPDTAAANRSQVVNALVKSGNPDAWNAIVPAIQSLQAGGGGAGGGRGGGGGRGAAPAAASAGQSGTLSSAQQIVAAALVETPNATLLQNLTTARNALQTAAWTSPVNQADLTARAASVAAAEQALATARANAFAKLQASALKLSAAQKVAYSAMQSVAAPPAAAAANGRGGGGGGRGGAGRGGIAASPADQARSAVLNSPNLDANYTVFITQAAKMDGDASQVADSVLLNLGSRKIGSQRAATAARQALDTGWSNPQRKAQIIMAAVSARDISRASQIVQATSDTDPAVAALANYAVQQLALDPERIRAEATQPKIGSMQTNAVLDAIMTTKGDVAHGQQVIGVLGCLECHTVNTSEAPKGPFLGAISGIMQRRDIAEAILVPSKTIAQGFPATQVTLKSGTQLTGFVVREQGDAIVLRNNMAQESRVATADIANRRTLEVSLMPPGLTADLTLYDFASLLDYLESLGK